MGKKAPTHAYLMLLAGMAIFGSATPVSKLITQTYSPLAGAGLRLIIAALFFIPFVLDRWSRIKDISRRDWWILLGIAVVGVVGFSVLMLYGMQRVSGVVGSIIMATTPAVTALGAWLFMGDKLGWRKLVAVGLAVIGVLVLQLAGGSQDNSASAGFAWLGAALVFGAILCEATYTLLGKASTNKLDPVLTAGLSSWIAAVLYIPLIIWQWEPRYWNADWESWLAVGWWGAGTMGLGSLLWYQGVQKVPGSIAAAFMGVMPVSALVLSYILLGEQFKWIHLLGFAIVLAGVLLIAYTHAQMAKKQPQSESSS